MLKKETYRHELKYQIHYADYLAVRQRLRQVMKPDGHAGADGRYVIRSIYFDNADDKALREKVNGVQKREKFRIRYYNDDFSYIRLEKKIKSSAVLSGKTDWMTEHSSGLVQELFCKMRSQQLRPRVMVSYVREPYVYPAGNVRVTFDSQVRSTLFHRSFLENQISDICVADEPGDIILEVKFDAFLPDIIQTLLQTEGIRQQAYSKYGACRRFG